MVLNSITDTTPNSFNKIENEKENKMERNYPRPICKRKEKKRKENWLLYDVSNTPTFQPQKIEFIYKTLPSY